MKTSLVIIFNQDFSANVEKLEELYADRFDRIDYLVPTTFGRLTRESYRTGRLPISLLLGIDVLFRFSKKLLGRKNKFSILNTNRYSKYKDRVHTVLADQYFFYHYISQASEKLLAGDSEWFWFIGDDAILNSNIDQNNFFNFLGIDTNREIDAVVCKPVISSDAWLAELQGSVQIANNKLVQLIGTNQPYNGKLDVLKEDPQSENDALCVACADFFGVRRDVLEKSINDFNEALRSRMFVEICVPNVLINNASNPYMFDQFNWVRQPDKEEMEEMISQIHDAETVFVHPLKLSEVPITEISRGREEQDYESTGSSFRS